MPALRGHGSVTDFDLSTLYDDSKSLNEGALRIPGYSMEGWYGRIYRGCGFFDPDKPIRKYTRNELHDLLRKEPTKIKVDGINLTYEGLFPKIQKSFLSKDVDAMQPHVRAFVERAVIFSICPDCGGTRLSEAARSSKIKGISIADACALQISDLADVEQLLGLLDRLVDAGKSVIVIAHHQVVMAHADWIIGLGPGAGHDGGRIVFQGQPAALVAARSTLTGKHLADYVGAKAKTGRSE